MIHTTADIAEADRYRYWLTRDWTGCGPVALFIMLNPSIADATRDDPTIRRCVNFAKRENINSIAVANLFAYRATKPADLVEFHEHFGLTAVVGPENDEMIDQRIRNVDLVIVAWGASPLAERTGRAETMRQLIESHGKQTWCLGKTASGAPRHPLYVKGDQPLEVWP